MIRRMSKRKLTPAYIAAHIRRVLKDGGSAPHAEGVQRFFKETIQSRGWRTAELRKIAIRFRRAVQQEMGLPFVVQVADRLFNGRVLEEKVLAVLLLEKSVGAFGDTEFKLFEAWISRISNWADHDALAHYLIAPMIMAKPSRSATVFQWAQSPDRWHRRAACVALIQGTRRQMFARDVVRLSNLLLQDEDDMVQKGLGWLLRETAKAGPERMSAYLMRIRERAPRLVLRTACETLPPAIKQQVLLPLRPCKSTGSTPFRPI